MQLRVDKKGKITIPKYIRDKHNLNHNVAIEIRDNGSGIIITPVMTCSNCGKALPDELFARGACLECEPKPREIIKIY